MTEFEKVFSDNKDFVFRYLLKLSGDPSAADELTQETFFRAYMNYAGLRNKEKLSVWLIQIAKNTYYAWYKEQKKITPLNDEYAHQDSMEEALADKELSQKLLACLHELDEPYKEVFMLSVLGGLFP